MVREPAARRRAHLFLAGLIVFGWVGACWYSAPSPKTIWFYDAPVYLSMAYDLEHVGRFTDGTGWGTPSADPTRPSGMIRSPLDPAFLAVSAELDPVFGRTLDCLVQTGLAPSCPQSAPLPRILQFLMTVAVFLMTGRIAHRLTGSPRIAWLSLGVALITAPVLIRYAQTLMTETLCLFFTTLATLAAVEVFRGRRPFAWAVLSGAMIGLATLTRPNFLYFLPAVGLVALPIVLRSPQRRRGMATLAAFLLAGVCVITPWVLRNRVVLGHFGLTSGYAQLALTQRVAFDAMGWRQFAAFNLCSLPDGVGMGSLLIGPTACNRFGYEIRPDTFYGVGSTTILHSPAVVAGGTRYVLVHDILAHPVWHALVSIPMAMRGLWIDHYWGFVLAVLCVPLTVRALRARDAATLAITLPGWLMLAFYAALSANQTRFNLMLIVPFSFAGGLAVDRLVRRLTARHWQSGDSALRD